MKAATILSLGLAAVMAFTTADLSFAQSDLSKKEIRQAQKEIKNSRKTLYQKANKSVRKDAKRLEKDGWQSMDLPLEKIVERRNEKLWQDDAEGYPKFIHASVTATGGSYAAAQTSARTQAVIEIATQIQTTVAAMIDNSVANDETTPEMGISLNKTLSDAKVIVAQKLGRIINTGTIYRMKGKKGNSLYEVRGTYIYDMRQAANIAKESMQEALAKEAGQHRNEFNKLFGFDKFSAAYEDQNFDEDL